MPKPAANLIPGDVTLRAVIGPHRPLPLAHSLVSAGYPSPAEDHVERRLDINDYLVLNELTTHYMRAGGTSMTRAGILPRDILVVDRSLEPRDGDVVVAAIDNALICKRLRRRRGEVVLLSEEESTDGERVVVEPGSNLEVWGVVRHLIHTFR